MPVFCQLQLKRAPLTKSKVSYRNVAAINMDALRKDLSNSSLCKNIESLDLNDLVDCYNKTLESVLNHHAPLKTKIVTTRPVVAWFNEEVKSAKRQRRKAERRWRRTRSYSDLKAYKMQKNYTILVMNRARKSFYTDFISDNSTDQRQLFKAAKILFTQRSDLTFPDYEDSNILANDIGEFFIQKIERIRAEFVSSTPDSNYLATPESTPLTFCFDSFEPLNEENVKDLISKSSKKSSSMVPIPTPLVIQCQDVLLPVITRMINLSSQSGVFADDWKQADVHPQLKKSKTETAFENLRPISNLSFVSKLTERAVFNQTNDHLNSHELYPKNQSAYRKSHSTETALLRVKHDILLNMNRQHVTLLVILDLTAAFDTVDHSIMLGRLSSTFGIQGQVLHWFTSYLSNRSQYVSVNGGISKRFELQYGVSQGSCLGPLLFVLYVSKLFQILESHLPDAHAFADDNQLYVSFKPDSTIDQIAAVTAMESCIDDIKNWMLNDKLKLNDSKTEFLIIGTRQQLSKVNFNTLRVGDAYITPSNEIKNLGSWFDSQMKFDTNINKWCKAAFFHLFNIRRIRKFLTHETVQILINPFVTSRLDYCNSLYYGLPASQINKLQRVQNAAARLICYIPRFEHITPILHRLHWLPVKYRINFKVLLIVFKALHDLAPDYIIELISIKPPSSYSTRSNSELLLQRPNFKTLVTLGDRSFSPTLWNTLPSEIRQADSVTNFKRILKTYLFNKAYYNM